MRFFVGVGLALALLGCPGRTVDLGGIRPGATTWSPPATAPATLQGTCIVDVSCPAPASNRQELFLSGDPASNAYASGWRFFRGDQAGAERSGFDDSAWTSISVPYTWNQLDGQDGPDTPYYRGVGWYRKHFTIPPSMAGKRIYIQFDEAAYTTDLYVNGTHVGQHRGGYARFRFDVTSVVTIGADSVIAVKVDNSAAVDEANNKWDGGTNANVAPLTGDFTLFGGIERDVRVLATDNLAITPLDFGGPGVYLTATDVTASSATFTATVRLLNMGAAATASVEVDILDETNGTVKTLTGTQPVPAGTTADMVLSGRVASPHLWNGLSDPYMYHVNVLVMNGTAVTDAIVQPFGFRSYNLDPNTGFSLNGNAYPLHGVGMHQDHHNLGGQFSFQDALYINGILQDFGFLKEMGAAFTRFAQYQHSDFTYSLADGEGIVAWAENPFVNRVPETCIDLASCQPFMDDTQQQMVELIRQNYNHPSIFFWGVGNEALLQQGPDPYLVMQNLVQVAEKEDPSRTVVYASNENAENADDTLNNESGPYPQHASPVWLAQATYFNEYLGWYGGYVQDVGTWADTDHAGHPDTPIGLSEYGAGANPEMHGWPIVETGINRTASPNPLPQTEEYQSFFHEGYWAAIVARPFLTITSVWNLFDFATDYRDEADEPGLNTKGLVTYDRSIKKDAFYFYKAQWSAEPVTYITSRRFPSLPQSSTTIKVYSNRAPLTLTLNGAPLGPPSEQGNHVYVWTHVPWDPGSNTAMVTAPSGCAATDPTACADQVSWTN